MVSRVFDFLLAWFSTPTAAAAVRAAAAPQSEIKDTKFP
jgi:hypothetical protein